MVEPQIFYWTGKISWWCVCTISITTALIVTVLAPIYVFHRVKKVWWKWATLAKFSDLGWSQDELRHISIQIGGADEEFLEKARKVVEVAGDMHSDVDKVLRNCGGVQPDKPWPRY